MEKLVVFSFSLLPDKHLKEVKKEHGAFYDLIQSLRVASELTIHQFLNKGENGLKKLNQMKQKYIKK